MASKEANKPEAQAINLWKLSLAQLSQLKKQLDNELAIFNDSIQTIKMAQKEFTESRDCVEKIDSSYQGKQILVPLSGSMYVPGLLEDSEHVLVDVGTGYFVNMKRSDAIEYFNRRIVYVGEQVEAIQKIGLEKSKIRDAVFEQMEIKLQATLAAQKQTTTTT